MANNSLNIDKIMQTRLSNTNVNFFKEISNFFKEVTAWSAQNCEILKEITEYKSD
jgi:hypothetical protein